MIISIISKSIIIILLVSLLLNGLKRAIISITLTGFRTIIIRTKCYINNKNSNNNSINDKTISIKHYYIFFELCIWSRPEVSNMGADPTGGGVAI